MKHSLRSVLLALVVLGLGAAAEAVTNPPQCAYSGSHLVCPMVVNAQTWYHVEPGYVLMLQNTLGYDVQINEVYPVALTSDVWAETCAFIDDGSPYVIYPQGYGEIGCVGKMATDSSYPFRLKWDGVTTAAKVKAGHVLGLGFQGPAHEFLVTVLPASPGIEVWRQPKADYLGFFYCNGQQQITGQEPWRNTSGHTRYVTGALIYGVSGFDTYVDAACIHVFSSDGGSVLYGLCQNGLNQRGIVSLNLAIQPGEYLSGYAVNTCPTGVWDWAAFFFVSY